MKIAVYIVTFLTFFIFNPLKADEFVISNLVGNSYDYNNGNVKSKNMKFSSQLHISSKNNKITLNTGTTKITNGRLEIVSDQKTFIFKAQMALWSVTCYPRLGLSFVNVYSDASEYGGAKMINLYGKCTENKN